MHPLILAGLLLLAIPALAERPPESAYPSRGHLASHLQVFPFYGEAIGPAVACGLRPIEWAETLRRHLYAAIRASYWSGTDDEDTIKVVVQFEAFAQRQAIVNHRGYCSDPDVVGDIELADAFVVGTDELNERLPLPEEERLLPPRQARPNAAPAR